jgi:hypothetical protein
MAAYFDNMSIYSDTLGDYMCHIQAVCQCHQDRPILKSRIELQCLNGVIIYHAKYLPHLVTIMALLTDLISEDGFEWHPIYEDGLAEIKRLGSEISVLRPINYTSGEPIFLFTDSSKVGAGAWVGQ